MTITVDETRGGEIEFSQSNRVGYNVSINSADIGEPDNGIEKTIVEHDICEEIQEIIDEAYEGYRVKKQLYSGPLREIEGEISIEKDNIREIAREIEGQKTHKAGYSNVQKTLTGIYCDERAIKKPTEEIPIYHWGSVRKVRASQALKALGKDPEIINVTSIKMKVTLGNTDQVKKDFYEQGILRTCQKLDEITDNNVGVAAVAKNGYLLPLLLWKGKKCVGRMMCREMYYMKKKYIMIDRLYIDSDEGSAREKKREIYVAICERLRGEYSLIVPKSSQHDQSCADYVNIFPLKRKDNLLHARTGLYLGVHTTEGVYGYYHDSYSKTATVFAAGNIPQLMQYDYILDFYILEKTE